MLSFSFKLITVGDTSVGKSCIVARYFDSDFNERHKPTIGVEFKSKNISYKGHNIKIQIWDTVLDYIKGSVEKKLIGQLLEVIIRILQELYLSLISPDNLALKALSIG